MSFHGSATYVTRAIRTAGERDVAEGGGRRFEIVDGISAQPGDVGSGRVHELLERSKTPFRKISFELAGAGGEIMSTGTLDGASGPCSDEPIPKDARLYDRIIDDPDPADVGADDLKRLASKVGEWPSLGLGDIPAGFNYFAQFVAHELSRLRDTGTPGDKRYNWTTPAFDLASLFGDVPEAPSRDKQPKFDERRHLIIGELALGQTKDGLWEDLPRASDGSPLIPDTRNDSNLALAQVHVALIKFYQVVATLVPNDPREQRRITRRHLQSIVLHDLLPRLVDQKIYCHVLKKGRSIVAPGNPAGFLTPLEFAAAFFRFGHSMVRETYRWNNGFEEEMTPKKFLKFTHHGGEISAGNPPPDSWTVDWSTLIELSGSPDLAEALDGNIAWKLQTLNDSDIFETTAHECEMLFGQLGTEFHITALTLLRGQMSLLPNARQVWDRVHGHPANEGFSSAEMPLSNQARETLRCVCPDLVDRPPLWLHMVDEAMHPKSEGGTPPIPGRRLGPMAGLIIAETLHAAVAASPDSILDADGQPEFTVLPALNGTYPDRYSLADLVRAVHRN